MIKCVVFKLPNFASHQTAYPEPGADTSQLSAAMLYYTRNNNTINCTSAFPIMLCQNAVNTPVGLHKKHAPISSSNVFSGAFGGNLILKNNMQVFFFLKNYSKLLDLIKYSLIIYLFFILYCFLSLSYCWIVLENPPWPVVSSVTN